MKLYKIQFACDHRTTVKRVVFPVRLYDWLTCPRCRTKYRVVEVVEQLVEDSPGFQG